MTDAYTGPDRRREHPPFWWPGIRGFLSGAIVLLIVSITLVLLARPPQLDERTSNVLAMILGVLLGCFKDVYNYNFSSTQASQEKDRTIAEQGKALAGSAPVPMTTTTTVDPGPPPSATTTTGPAEPKGQ